MVRIKALLLGIAAALICSTGVAQTITVEDYRLMEDKYEAWNLLCFELRDVDCTGIPVPNVERQEMAKNLAGYYDGSDTVFINEKLRGLQRLEVLAHEMSHYIDVQTMGLKVPVYNGDIEGIKGLCFSEKRAWAVSDNFWKQYKNNRMQVGAKWVKWYDHCRPYADLLYPDVYDKPLPRQAWWSWLF